MRVRKQNPDLRQANGLLCAILAAVRTVESLLPT